MKSPKSKKIQFVKDKKDKKWKDKDMKENFWAVTFNLVFREFRLMAAVNLSFSFRTQSIVNEIEVFKSLSKGNPIENETTRRKRAPMES